MNLDFREKIIPENTEFKDCDFNNVDFTKTVMNEVVFINVNFSNCIFNKTLCIQTRFWACFFDNCTFKAINFSNTNIGAWGGAQINCKFIKCKLNKITDASYIIDSVFDNCKIKSAEIRSLYMKNVKFIGLLDDFSIRKFNSIEINQNQTIKKVISIKQKIKLVCKTIFENEKVFLNEIDFSEARMQFIDFSDCEIVNCNFPKDNKHLFISKNLNQIVQNVSNDILLNWNDEETKSWALTLTQNFKNQIFAIICYYEFKYFENDIFAENLFNRFLKFSNLNPKKICNEN